MNDYAREKIAASVEASMFRTPCDAATELGIAAAALASMKTGYSPDEERWRATVLRILEVTDADRASAHERLHGAMWTRLRRLRGKQKGELRHALFSLLVSAG